ncbi:MAG: lysine biosynthesis protein LysX [Crenarchaeota archaeon]|nr:lysine biosynthesis protein LysX [Thermoproteota archaeon]
MRVLLVYDYAREEEKRIKKELENRGVNCIPVNVLRTYIDLSSEGEGVAVIRPVAMYTAAYSAAALEAQGFETINNSSTIITAGDKALTYSILRRHKVPIPRTILVLDARPLQEAARLLGYPLVDKPPIGSWGRLVTLIENTHQLKTIAEHRSILGSKQLRVHLLQEYIPSGSTDIRCIVVDDEMIGCMKRIAARGEWRSNVALGARVERYRADGELEDLAIRAAKALGGFFVSLDFFNHPDRGYLVNEVNGVPEFKGFMHATGVNVAAVLVEKIIEHYKR